MIDKITVKKINRCIRRIAQGHMDALEALFTLTKKQLFIVASAHLSDKSKAEDVLSDSYCKVVKSAKTFDAKCNGYNWLYEIVKNTALNQNEKDALRAHPSLEEVREPMLDTMDALLNHVMAEEAVSQLTDEEKLFIYHYFFEGLTIQELADSLGKPKTTVYDQFKRTLAKMRKTLGVPEQKADKVVYKCEDRHEEERD